jgi:galactosylceramidase
VYGLDIDYLGCWNERPYNASYLQVLRSTLDEEGYSAVKLIAADSSFDGVAEDVLSNPSFAKAIWGLGAHYPNMQSGIAAEQTGKQLWASEEDSTYNNAVGAGCWARVINQNYVRGNMTSSINWNLIAAYQKGTNWWRAGLMTAFQPWSGHYGSFAMIWATAHTAQFAQPDTFSYLANGTGTGTGSGLLSGGGSYVTLQNFETGDFSIIIEKMSRDHSPCCRPSLPNFDVVAENATFHLAGAPAKATSLRLWRTHWSFGAAGDKTEEFIEQPPITVIDRKFSLLIEPDSLYTVTTITTGHKGSPQTPIPEPAPFPSAYYDDFEACTPSSEAKYFSDQNGIFECQPKSADSAHGVVMRQMVPLLPIAWGGDTRPHTIIGSRDLADVSMAVDVRLTGVNGSLMIGARLGTTSTYGDYYGVVFSFDVAGNWNLTASTTQAQSGPTLANGVLNSPLGVSIWHRVQLDVNGTRANIYVDGAHAIRNVDVSYAGATGFVSFGTVQFGHYTEYDNFALYSTQLQCGSAPVVGALIKAVSCASEVGPRAGTRFVFSPTNATMCPYGSPCQSAMGTFSLVSDSSLCLAVQPGSSNTDWPLVLAPCTIGDSNQVFTQGYTMLYSSSIHHTFSNRYIGIPFADIGTSVLARTNKSGGEFVYVGDEQEIVSINVFSVCLGTC